MEKKSTLRVNLDSIIFRDLKIGETDSIDIWVHNTGKSPVQIKFLLSPKSPFKLIQDYQNITPPGLDATATIQYIAKDISVIKDTLQICSPNQTIEIPITAIPPSSRIVPERNSLNLGNVGYKTDFKFSFVLANIGINQGTFQLSSTNPDVTFIPEKGKIYPGKSLDISGNLNPQSLGEYKFQILIETEGAHETPPPIDVTATSLLNSLVLQVDGCNVNELDFGSIYFGQKRIVTATIINQGPYQRSFAIFPPQNSPIDTTLAEAVDHSNLKVSDTIFSAIPMEGLLNQYEKKDIKFLFNPPLEKLIQDDLESVFNQYSSIEVVETGQKIDFSFVGKAVHHLIELSEMDFIFGKNEVGKKITKTLSIKNQSHYLSTSFEIQPVAQFHFQPSKGTISPTSEKGIKIIFSPNNLGEFDTQTKISFSNGLVSKHINLSGSSVAKLQSKPFQRVPVWESEKTALYSVQHPDPRFTYDLNEIKENQKKRDKFDSYITDSAAKRTKLNERKEYMERIRKEAENHLTQTMGANGYLEADIQEYIKTHKTMLEHNEELNLGIQPMEGLTPPDPPINTKPAPLYLKNPAKFGLSDEKTNEKSIDIKAENAVKPDKDQVIKKKFKPKPTTPNEIVECNKNLTPAQQLMVVASQQAINVGQISVFSKVVKPLNITNNLQQNILVTFNYEYDELSESTPISQVIPPKQTSGFDLKFTSSKAQSFMKTITYNINGHHSCSVNFNAQVVPIELDLKQTILEFRFSPDSIHPIIHEFVTIVNKSNSRAEFNFIGLAPPFSMPHSKGHVEPNKSINVEITYSPGTRNHDELDIIMNTLGGPSRALKLIGDTGMNHCTLQKKQLNLGLIPVGIVKTQSIRIKNSGDDDAIFSITNPNPQELQVTPKHSRIACHDSIQLQVSYKSLTAQCFDIPVTVTICGSQPLVFNVNGQSELPQVYLQSTEFDFGRVFVGSSAAIETEIMNTGCIPAILFLDLQSHPEFRIEFPSEYADLGVISLVSDPCFVTKLESTSEYLPSEKPSTVSTKPQTPIKDDEKAEEEIKTGLIYKIQLDEHCSLPFSLIFQPTEPCDVSFELPITMMNVISSNSFHLQPIVSAVGVQAPLTLTKNNLDFGVAPIFQESNPNSRPIVDILSVINESKTDLNWYFTDLDDEIRDSFIIEPSSGLLQVGSKIIVHVSFTPRDQTPYNTYLSLYVKTDKDDSLIGQVHLTGVGSNLPYRMSLTEVCLPIVPLNTVSSQLIYVINQSFIEGSLKVQMACDENKFPVKITFTEGNQLQHSTEKLPVLVSFQSPQPISFSTLIALIDDAGNAASFSVSCTADNSCLTLFTYLQNNPKKKTDRVIELTSRFVNVSDFIELKKVDWKPTCSQLMVDFYKRYLNAIIISPQLSNFPEDFISSQGQLLLQIVSNLTGSKKTFNDDKASTPEKRLESMKKILTYLTSQGALLSSVKPEYLLNRVDFMHLMRQKVTKQILGIDYFNAPPQTSFNQQILGEFLSSQAISSKLIKRLTILEDLYNALSSESWMMVLMQVFRLFVMPRLDPDKLLSTPGLSDALRNIKSSISKYSNSNTLLNEINKQPKAINGSNFFSRYEMSLLKWAGIHYANATQDYNKKFNDFTLFSDALAIAALIKMHTNTPIVNLNHNPIDNSQKETNAIEVINSIRSLKLSFCPNAKEIVYGTQCMIAMTLSYLYDTLPHFIPQTLLEFATSLHRPITKMISLSNPSKSDIIYKATFEGNKNFELPHDSITIPAGQTMDFPILFNARTLKVVNGRLSLIPSRPRMAYVEDSETDGRAIIPQYSAPVIIDTISQVSVTSPDQSLTIEGQIYQPTKLTLNVTNKLGGPTTLTVFSRIIKIEDENGRSIPHVKSLQDEMISFINSPLTEEKNNSHGDDVIDTYINKHKPILLDTNSITLSDSKSTATIEVEFVPITLGTYRCLILLADETKGEMIYEIIAKSVVPQPIDVNSNKLKIESGKKISIPITIDQINSHLMYALAYSVEKAQLNGQPFGDRKLRDMVLRRQREIESQYKQNFKSKKFIVTSSSPQYYDIMNEMTITKSELRSNVLPITFKPIKAGEYPCKILLTSRNDVRCYSLKGIGIAATKTLVLEFQTVACQSMVQEIPIQNLSKETWSFKITLVGDTSCFTSPQRITVKPNSTSPIPITFSPSKIGQFHVEVQIYNINKESTIVYKCAGNASEPPTEDKIVLNCRARQPTKHKLDVKPFIQNGLVEVTSTIPIIQFPSTVSISGGRVVTPFEFTVLAPRSGVAAGTLTFKDKVSNNYIWYVIEIHVDSPQPEQTIEVKTTARKPVVVTIPISNSKGQKAHFAAQFSEEIMSGLKEFDVEPHSSTEYALKISPLTEMKKSAAAYFFSEEDGEFWYSFQIEVEQPPENILAPLTAPIGKSASTFILIENNSKKAANYTIENDNLSAFNVLSKQSFSIPALDQKRIEIQYIPTSVGVKEMCLISIKSKEGGDWFYRLTGTGKPPQPLSPIIVSANILNTSSALILFSNPFPYPAKFSVSMISDNEEEVFTFLNKKRNFTLNHYNEETQIPFTFSPKINGQFKANIIIASLGPSRAHQNSLSNIPNIQWVYPIIGNSSTNEINEKRILKCRAHESSEQEFKLTLVGEAEPFSTSEYQLFYDLSKDFEFVKSILDIQISSIEKVDSSSLLTIIAKFSPNRPISKSMTLKIKNPLGQEWQFVIELIAELGKIQGTITIESLLNKIGTSKITLNETFSIPTPFHAYFISGSANELTVSSEHGMIKPSIQPIPELPLEVIFAPKMYGKVFKGVLVIDTMESQYLFDVCGKTPEYVPPVIVTAKQSNSDDFLNPPPVRKNKAQSSLEMPKKRNFIRENIAMSRIVKPRVKTSLVNPFES